MLTPGPVWAWPLLLSPFVGSLLGVLAMRLPAGRPVALARSACDHCHSPLHPRDLVPVLSYVALRGRCRRCAAPIGRSHLLIELAAIAVALVCVLVFILARPSAPPAWLWSACLLGWAALPLAWIDQQCFRLPDAITLPLLLAGLASIALRDPTRLGNHALACLLAYAGFRLLSIAYRRLRGRDGLGAGDAKLLAAGGAWLGLAPMPWLLLAASLSTLLLALISGRTRAGDAVPFGPGLAASLWLLFLCA